MRFYARFFNVVTLAYGVYNDGIGTGVTDPRETNSIKYSKSKVTT